MKRAPLFRGRIRRFSAVSAAAALVGSVALVGVASTAGASVARNEIITYTYSSVAYSYSYPTYYETNDVITINPCDGTFTGTAVNSVWGDTVIQGYSTSENTATFTDSYTVFAQTNYVKTVNITLNPDGSFTGTWSDNLLPIYGGPLSGTVVTGAPTVTYSTYANHGQYVSSMGGGSDAAHSCIGMPIQS